MLKQNLIKSFKDLCLNELLPKRNLSTLISGSQQRGKLASNEALFFVRVSLKLKELSWNDIV